MRLPAADLADAPLALARPVTGQQANVTLRDIRLVDGRWFEPMILDRERRPATPDGLSRALALAMKESTWGDWPFGVEKESLERRKVEAVLDADLDVVSWECDYDALANREAASLSTRLALVGGALYRATRRPEILVKVECDTHPPGTGNKPRAVRVAWECLGEGDVAREDVARGTLSVQRWSPANAGAADRFVEAYARMTGARVVRQQAWAAGPALGALARDDVAAHDADVALTLRSRNETYAGRLRSDLVSLWLRARDTADAGAFDRLPEDMKDLATALGSDRDPWARGMLARLLPDLLRMALERPTAGLTVGGHGPGAEAVLDEGMEGFTP